MPLSLALHRSLSQPDTLQKLVKYVTEMPASSDSEARRYKYPFVSSEVLSCDIPAVRDAIFEGRQHLTQLLTLLQQPPPLPPVLAGYVAKVITVLGRCHDVPMLARVKGAGGGAAHELPKFDRKHVDRVLRQLRAEQS